MESFNGKLRDERRHVEVFDTLWEAKVLAERWRREYNQRRPHSALAYRPPAPEARLPTSQALASIPGIGSDRIDRSAGHHGPSEAGHDCGQAGTVSATLVGGRSFIGNRGRFRSTLPMIQAGQKETLLLQWVTLPATTTAESI